MDLTGDLLRARRGHGPAGPFDEIVMFLLILVLVFGYTPLEALNVTGEISYWTFVAIVAPICLLFVAYLAYDSEPIGGERDDWWDSYASQVNQRHGIERINKVTLTEGSKNHSCDHDDHHHH